PGGRDRGGAARGGGPQPAEARLRGRVCGGERTAQPVCSAGEVTLGVREHPRVEPAAKLIGAGTHPVSGQQRGRKHWILEVDLAVLVDQERAHEEGGLRRDAVRCERGLDRRELRDKAPVPAREISEVPAAGGERAV